MAAQAGVSAAQHPSLRSSRLQRSLHLQSPSWDCAPIAAQNLALCSGSSRAQLQCKSNLSIGGRCTHLLPGQAENESKSSFLSGSSASGWGMVTADTKEARSITRRPANHTVTAQAAVPQDEPVLPDAPSLVIARRQVLAAGAATTAGLLLPHQGQAAPIVLTPDDLKSCAVKGCCVDFSSPPFSKVPERVRFTPMTGPVRTRKATRNLTTQERRMLNRAYELLRQKADEEPNDPRWFLQQANVHCAYCNQLYQYSSNGAKYPLQVHFGWFFLPWHRLYLHFHERILISLLKTDPEFAAQADSFALPFWNYDAVNENSPDCRVPSVFNDQSGLPSLYNATRTVDDIRSPLVSLNFANEGASAAQIIIDNKAAMFRNVVNATTTGVFFGGATRAGQSPNISSGALERVPHDPVHVWVGGDMGDFTTAGQDPIFYGGHHANIDRLWSVWLTLGGLGNPRQNPTDPDWLGASFLFFDENRNLVEAKVSDAIDTQGSLRYKYESVPMPWRNLPRPPVPGGPFLQRTLLATSVTRRIDALEPATSSSPAVPLNKEPLVISRVARSPPSDLKAARNPGPVRSLLKSSGISGLARSAGVGALTVPDFKEEVLVLQGVSYPSDKPTHLNVFINLPDANPNTSLDCAEYAGSFTTVPMSMNMTSAGGMTASAMTSEVEVRLSIGSVLEGLGLTDASDFVVTIVPAVGERTDFGDVSIKGVAVEYES